MINKENDAVKNGGWPHGYIKTAYDNNLIDLPTYLKIEKNNVDSYANRGEVAKIIYNAIRIHKENNQSIKKIHVFINNEIYKEELVYEITDFKTNQNLPDSMFIFDETQHPNVEVIDMR